MRGRHTADAYDVCRYLRAARSLDSDGGSSAAGDIHGGVQLSDDLDGNFAVVYHLLSAGKLAEAVPGYRIAIVLLHVYGCL